MDCQQFEKLTKGVKSCENLKDLPLQDGINLFRHMVYECGIHKMEKIPTEIANAIGENYFDKGDPEKGVLSTKESFQEILRKTSSKKLLPQE